MIKILRVISSMDPKGGGPCQGIRNSIPALRKLGVENEVVCLDAFDSDYIGSDAFPIHAIGGSKGPWGYSEKLLPWLKTYLHTFDVVIVHGLWQYTSYAVYKIFKDVKPTKTKYFVMPHGMLDPYFQKAPDRRLKAMRNWLFWKLFESKVVNNTTGILFTCQEELMLARQTFKPYKPAKELNVGYGIEAPPIYDNSMRSAFKLVSNGLNDRPYLLFLSRIHQKKGVDLLITAYLIWMNKTKAHERLDLVIAGPGMETDYGQALLQTVANSDALKEHVHFTGMLSGDSKWGAFYGCDAFILPSHQENFGIAIVEALACCKPVLISNKVNIWREIHQAEAGFVSDDDLNGTLALFENWKSLMDKEKLAMVKNARNIFETLYAIEPAAIKLKDTLEKSIK